MKKNLYDVTPLDETEEELMRDDVKYVSIDNLEDEKLRYQKIAKSSIAKRELLHEVMVDSDFEPFLKTISDSGLNIKDAFHNFFHKVANGTISTKQLSNS